MLSKVQKITDARFIMIGIIRSLNKDPNSGAIILVLAITPNLR